MCSFTNKIKDHYNILKSYTKFKLYNLMSSNKNIVNDNFINNININFISPINYLKIDEDNFKELECKFGSTDGKVLIYETTYGYFIKPYNYIARFEFEYLFGKIGFGYDENKLLFYPKIE